MSRVAVQSQHNLSGKTENPEYLNDSSSGEMQQIF